MRLHLFTLAGLMLVTASCNLSGNDESESDFLIREQNVTVTTWAGSTQGYLDASRLAARFDSPMGIDMDDNQNLYVADYWNFVIRQITADDGLIDGNVRTWAGEKPGSGEPITFWPMELAAGNNGELYVTESNLIYKVTPDTITVFAGSHDDGDVDGVGAEARFQTPRGMVVASDGTIYIGMGWFVNESHKIKKISPDGVVETFAGSGISGHKDGAATEAQFSSPVGLALSPDEQTVYVACSSTIRMVNVTTGSVTTLAGKPDFSSHLVDGPLEEAVFRDIREIEVDGEGNLYVIEYLSGIIRKIDVTDRLVTTVAGVLGGFGGYKNGTGEEAEFSFPFDLAIDDEGSLYVSDEGNHRIRKITFN